MRAIRIALFTALALATGAAFAHHGWSEYDASKALTLTGKVTEVTFSQPHTVIKLDAEGKSWFAVLAPPSRMENRGIPSGTLKPGVTVTLVGYPHRQDASEMRAERITLGDKTVELR